MKYWWNYTRASDDAEEYNEAINDIYEKQNNISKIIGKQTHIIKAEVNNIHQDLSKKTKQIQIIQKELNETIQKIESQEPYWNYYMHYEKMIQWSTHWELKLENLYEIIKQFIKITEYAREGKLHPSTISKAQLLEVITEIHTKMEDYEFPIPTSHIRVELPSQIGKTDLKIKSGKFLISVDIPLLDRKALQLYEVS